MTTYYNQRGIRLGAARYGSVKNDQAFREADHPRDEDGKFGDRGKGGKQRSIKVGAWYSKFDEKQKDAFKHIMGTGNVDVNRVRKFLTAAKKHFGDQVERYLKGSRVITKEGKEYAYLRDKDSWLESR